MSGFRRSIWNELHGLTPQEVEIIKRFESDSRGSLFVAAADILRKRGYIDEAVVIMEDGVKLFPQYHTARASLGRDYFLKGMMNEAKHHIDIVVKKSADNPMAQRLKLKIDIIFDNKAETQERLAVIKQLIPDDDFTKSIRDLLAVDDWEGARALMHAELERLGIQWSLESEKEATDAALERLQSASPNEGSAPWEIPPDADSAKNPALAATEALEPKTEKPHIDETKLPTALRTGSTLAFVRGDVERYLAIKGFRRVQSEGLFSMAQNETMRRQSLDGETLAEIYAAQGFVAKSIGIYERLVRSHPEIPAYKERLVELHDALKNQGIQKSNYQDDSHKNTTQEKANRMNNEQEKKLRLLERILNKIDREPNNSPAQS